MKIAAIAFVRRGDKLLAIRRADNGMLAAPGGKVDPGEAPVETVLRELLEETGVRGHHPRLLSVGQGANNYLVHRFMVDIAPDAIPWAAEPAIAEVLWVTPEDLAAGFGGEFHGPAMREAGLLR